MAQRLARIAWRARVRWWEHVLGHGLLRCVRSWRVRWLSMLRGRPAAERLPFEACVGHVLIWLALVAAELAAVGLAQPPCAAMLATELRSARAVQFPDDRWRFAASRLLWYRQSKLALC